MLAMKRVGQPDAFVVQPSRASQQPLLAAAVFPHRDEPGVALLDMASDELFADSNRLEDRVEKLVSVGPKTISVGDDPQARRRRRPPSARTGPLHRDRSARRSPVR